MSTFTPEKYPSYKKLRIYFPCRISRFSQNALPLLKLQKDITAKQITTVDLHLFEVFLIFFFFFFFLI